MIAVRPLLIQFHIIYIYIDIHIFVLQEYFSFGFYLLQCWEACNCEMQIFYNTVHASSSCMKTFKYKQLIGLTVMWARCHIECPLTVLRFHYYYFNMLTI